MPFRRDPLRHGNIIKEKEMNVLKRVKVVVEAGKDVSKLG